MFRYLVAAAGLKVFSFNPSTRKFYRTLGNTLGQNRRKRQPIERYVKRGDLLISLMNRYGVLRDGTSMLELGTGWMHWYGLYTRLHADVQMSCFDVWDNRQFDALLATFGALRSHWEREGRLNGEQKRRLECLLDTENFDNLYRVFGMDYLIEGNGELDAYQNQSKDCIFSFHVLEHVHRNALAHTVSEMYRITKPGGCVIHQIGIDDHLAHYDPTASQKMYLKWPTKLRERFLENKVQYHNALQGADYVNLFESVGFVLSEVERERCNIDGISIHPEWCRYSQEDLETTVLTLVLNKPSK